MRFEGNPPLINDTAFLDCSINIYYPPNNDQWTNDYFKNYGGLINWYPDEDIGGGGDTNNFYWSLSASGVLTISILDNNGGPMPDYISSSK
jgi:hypothetical protein